MMSFVGKGIKKWHLRTFMNEYASKSLEKIKVDVAWVSYRHDVR